MSWTDNPRKWWAYQWLHHFWVLSFNRNPDLYRVVWWSRFTRPIFYNTRGHMRGGGDAYFTMLIAGPIIVLTVLFTIRNYLLGG